MFDKLIKLLKLELKDETKLSTNLQLKDQTQIYLEGNLENGVQCYLVTEDGNVSMPDGTYTLEDDTIIVVKEGLIFDIVVPDPETVETEMTKETIIETIDIPETEVREIELKNPIVSGEDTPTDIPTETPDEPEEIETPDVESRISDLEKKLQELMDKLNMSSEDKINNFETSLKELGDKISFIMDKYSAHNPIIQKKDFDSKNEYFSQDVLDKVEFIKKMNKNK